MIFVCYHFACFICNILIYRCICVLLGFCSHLCYHFCAYATQNIEYLQCVYDFFLVEDGCVTIFARLFCNVMFLGVYVYVCRENAV